MPLAEAFVRTVKLEAKARASMPDFCPWLAFCPPEPFYPALRRNVLETLLCGAAGQCIATREHFKIEALADFRHKKRAYGFYP